MKESEKELKKLKIKWALIGGIVGILFGVIGIVLLLLLLWWLA